MRTKTSPHAACAPEMYLPLNSVSEERDVRDSTIPVSQFSRKIEGLPSFLNRAQVEKTRPFSKADFIMTNDFDHPQRDVVCGKFELQEGVDFSKREHAIPTFYRQSDRLDLYPSSDCANMRLPAAAQDEFVDRINYREPDDESNPVAIPVRGKKMPIRPYSEGRRETFEVDCPRVGKSSAPAMNEQTLENDPVVIPASHDMKIANAKQSVELKGSVTYNPSVESIHESTSVNLRCDNDLMKNASMQIEPGNRQYMPNIQTNAEQSRNTLILEQYRSRLISDEDKHLLNEHRQLGKKELDRISKLKQMTIDLSAERRNCMKNTNSNDCTKLNVALNVECEKVVQNVQQQTTGKDSRDLSKIQQTLFDVSDPLTCKILDSFRKKEKVAPCKLDKSVNIASKEAEHVLRAFRTRNTTAIKNSLANPPTEQRVQHTSVDMSHPKNNDKQNKLSSNVLIGDKSTVACVPDMQKQKCESLEPLRKTTLSYPFSTEQDTTLRAKHTSNPYMNTNKNFSRQFAKLRGEKIMANVAEEREERKETAPVNYQNRIACVNNPSVRPDESIEDDEATRISGFISRFQTPFRSDNSALARNRQLVLPE